MIHEAEIGIAERGGGVLNRERPAVDLVKETVDLFGPDRCMFASNWHINGAVSNSDGADSCEVTMPELYATFQAWVDDWGLDAAAQRALFAGTAAKFYRL